MRKPSEIRGIFRYLLTIVDHDCPPYLWGSETGATKWFMSDKKALTRVGAFLLLKDDICNIAELHVFSINLYLGDIWFSGWLSQKSLQTSNHKILVNNTFDIEP
jgi:hypothetical protein